MTESEFQSEFSEFNEIGNVTIDFETFIIQTGRFFFAPAFGGKAVPVIRKENFTKKQSFLLVLVPDLKFLD